MRKRTRGISSPKITVDITELMQMLSAGRHTATQIGEAAGAVIQVGRRKLYLVPKVEQYLNSLAEQS